MKTTSYRLLKRFLIIAIILAKSVLPDREAHGQVLKFAVVLPDGSPAVMKIRELSNKLRKQTDGEVNIQIFAGGVAGNEVDVLRKMRINRIQIAGLTGISLRRILPSVALLEQPGLFRSLEEAAYIRKILFDEFAAQFARKGYILMGMAGTGFTYHLSQKKMERPADFASIKMWAWKGDEPFRIQMEAYGMTAVPLHITDVKLGLETGLINAVSAPPMAVTAFQWHGSVRHLFDLPQVSTTSAVLMSKQSFEGLSLKSRKVMSRSLKDYVEEWAKDMDEANQEATEVLRSTGIRFVRPAPEDLPVYATYHKAIIKKAIQNGYFSDAFYNRVTKRLDNYRKIHARAK